MTDLQLTDLVSIFPIDEICPQRLHPGHPMRLYDDVDPQLALPRGSQPISVHAHDQSRHFPTGCITVELFHGGLTQYIVKVTNERIQKKWD